MKRKHTAQLRQSVASTRRSSVSAFSHLRTLLALLVCSVAACSMLSGAVLAFFRPEAPSTASQRTLTFAERVGYQRVIEEVYWRHRIWPRSRGERPDPKPSLDAVMSQTQLEKKVAGYLGKSQALEDYQQLPITAEQLQGEMTRMAKHTKQPEVLRELFEALGNDPFVIAECLARPILSERLTADFLAQTERVKSDRLNGIANMPIATTAANGAYTLPQISEVYSSCIDDTWTSTSITNAPAGRQFHTAVWTGSEMIVWGGGDGTNYLNTGGRYNPSTDNWTATSTTNAPAARSVHTAVWTGSEMIVWGGYNGSTFFNTGGRYNPSTDSWTVTNITNAPAGRTQQTAVWTGSQMIVWGGVGNGGYMNTGGRYDPITDSWTATSTIGAPSARTLPKAVWTGGEMIVWGGFGSGGLLNSGGRYNPTTGRWTTTSPTTTPTARSIHTPTPTNTDTIARA